MRKRILCSHRSSLSPGTLLFRRIWHLPLTGGCRDVIGPVPQSLWIRNVAIQLSLEVLLQTLFLYPISRRIMSTRFLTVLVWFIKNRPDPLKSDNPPRTPAPSVPTHCSMGRQSALPSRIPRTAASIDSVPPGRGRRRQSSCRRTRRAAPWQLRRRIFASFM